MLKRLLVNGKKIPVPIPIATVGDMMGWLEQHVLSAGQVITKIQLGDDTIDLATAELAASLRSDILVSVTVETASELSYKILDAVPNLIALIVADLKPAAVKLWEAAGQNLMPEGVLPLIADLHLLADLTDQCYQLGMTAAGESTSVTVDPWLQLADQLKSQIVLFKRNLADGDCRAAARTLLNQIEPLVHQLDTMFLSQKDAVDRQALTA